MSKSFQYPASGALAAFVRDCLKGARNVFSPGRSSAGPSPSKLPSRTFDISTNRPLANLISAFLPAELRELQKLNAEIVAINARLAAAEGECVKLEALASNLYQVIGLSLKDFNGKPAAEVQQLVSHRLSLLANEQVASLGFAVPL